MPDIILMVCERFSEIASRDATDIRTIASANFRTTAELVVRAYSLTSDHEVKSRCLDLIDRMYLLGVFALDRVTAEFDR